MKIHPALEIKARKSMIVATHVDAAFMLVATMPLCAVELFLGPGPRAGSAHHRFRNDSLSEKGGIVETAIFHDCERRPGIRRGGAAEALRETRKRL
jgi:hypothetical protein